jgi:hypothetical protein
MRVRSRFGEKAISPTRDAWQGQVVRPKLDCCYMALFSWTAGLPGKSVGYLTDQHPCWCCVLPYGTVTIGSARPRGARPI